jgi:hypothetical protein
VHSCRPEAGQVGTKKHSPLINLIRSPVCPIYRALKLGDLEKGVFRESLREFRLICAKAPYRVLLVSESYRSSLSIGMRFREGHEAKRNKEERKDSTCCSRLPSTPLEIRRCAYMLLKRFVGFPANVPNASNFFVDAINAAGVRSRDESNVREAHLTRITRRKIFRRGSPSCLTRSLSRIDPLLFPTFPVAIPAVAKLPVK